MPQPGRLAQRMSIVHGGPQSHLSIIIEVSSEAGISKGALEQRIAQVFEQLGIPLSWEPVWPNGSCGPTRGRTHSRTSCRESNPAAGARDSSTPS